MAKAKKITKKELTEINEQQNAVRDVLIAVGALEVKKIRTRTRVR